MKKKEQFRLDGISLKAQLILSFLAVTILVLSVSSYYSYVKTMDILKKRMQDTTFSQSRQIETNTLTLMHEVDKLAKSFVLEDKVQTFLQSNRLPNPEFISLEREISERITHYLTNYEYLDSIYIFTNNGMVIGGTLWQNQSTTVVGKEYPFYSTSLYQAVQDKYPLEIWRGGLTTLDFIRSTIPSNLPNSRLISYLRGVSYIGSNKMVGELVFNVKERYYNSGYASLLSTPNGSISIVDDDGNVISSTFAESINQDYLFNDRIDPKHEFGSFSADREKTSEEINYYLMKKTGWMLIHEVPTELYTEDIVSIQRFVAGIFVFSLVLIVVFSSLWMNRIMKSFLRLINGMKHVERGNIGLTLPSASNREIGLLITQFNKMSTGILELINKNEETEKAKRKLEIEALQSQINPHFLYNTLNTVKWMAAVAKAPNIMECMTSLGKMLRPIFYEPSPYWSFNEEIEFVKNYVNIMNFRYGEEIQFKFEVPEEFLKCQTIRFMIQPLIENALIHGEMNKGVIQVSVSEIKGELLVVVHDTYGGMPQSKVDEVNRKIQLQMNGENPSKGIGLYNVNKRIQLHFGDQYGIEVKSTEDIDTSVFMKIPILYNSPAVQKS